MKNKTKRRIVEKRNAWRHVVANHIFVDCCYRRSLDDTCKRITRHKRVLQKLKAYMLDTSPWLRDVEYTGDNVYGYTSIEQVEGRLDYISDRFMAPCRLTWLMELPDRVAGLPLECDQETE